jgi:hypothetical protein
MSSTTPSTPCSRTSVGLVHRPGFLNRSRGRVYAGISYISLPPNYVDGLARQPLGWDNEKRRKMRSF